MPTVELSSVAGFPLFASFSAEDLRDLLAASQTVRLPKNGRVFTQGDDAKSFFVLLKGYVRATKTTADGDEIVVRYVSPGEMFGVAVTIGLDQYPATAVAVVDAVVLAWPSTSWPTLSAKYPGFASHALRTVGARLQEAHERIAELTTEEVERRIARVLLRLAEQAGRAVTGGVEIEFPLRRQDVAQLTGTTLHSASRVLSRWEEENVVVSNRQHIVVRDSASLSRIAEGIRH